MIDSPGLPPTEGGLADLELRKAITSVLVKQSLISSRMLIILNMLAEGETMPCEEVRPLYQWYRESAGG